MNTGRMRSIALIGLVAALAASSAGCSGDAANANSTPSALLQRRCSVCHSLERVKAANKTRAGWITTIDRMRSKGAAVNDSETRQLADYLASGSVTK